MKQEEKNELMKLGKTLTDDFVDRVILNNADENTIEFDVAKKIFNMASKREVGEEPSPGEKFVPKSTKELYEHLLQGFNETVMQNFESKEEMLRMAEHLIEIRKNLKSF